MWRLWSILRERTFGLWTVQHLLAAWSSALSCILELQKIALLLAKRQKSLFLLLLSFGLILTALTCAGAGAGAGGGDRLQ